jgi:hypothetical protein
VKVSSDPHYEQLRDLERRFPGWTIWAVPHGNPTTTHVVWWAQPLPLINAGSPEELAERIRTAHSQPPDGFPSLAFLRSYAARVRRLREYEEAAGAAWRRMRAGADARQAAVMADPVQRFYQRHGHPARCAEQVTTPDAAAAENEEPGTA